jgi:hypothetical protein
MIVTLDSKRRLTLPAGLVRAAVGDCFDVFFDAEEDTVIFRRLPEKEDWLDVLSECPVSMNDVPPRRKDRAKRRRHGFTIVTGNDKDFRRPGIKVFNPFKELPRA